MCLRSSSKTTLVGICLGGRWRSSIDPGPCTTRWWLRLWVWLPLTVIWVDPSHWWFRDKRWCHLVSDSNLDELHLFAEELGVPRRGFQGDHYDIPDDYRTRAIAMGATAVPSRELLQRLKAAGLRFTPSQRRAWGSTLRPDLKSENHAHTN